MGDAIGRHVSTGEEPGAGLWFGLAIGTPIVAYGTWQLVHHSTAGRTLTVATWAISAGLLHDLVLVPLMLTVVWLIGRIIPGRSANAVRAGVLGTALVVAIDWAALNGYGRRADNPSLQPLNATTATLTAVAVVWVLAGVVWAISWWRSRVHARSPRAGDRGPGRRFARSTRTPPPG